MEKAKDTIVTLSAHEGTHLAVAGGNYRVLISGAETGGAFATIEMHVPSGGGPGPHAHPDFQESFYVLEGEVEVQSEEGIYTAGKGSYISIPKGGIVHGFKNKSDHLAKLLCVVVPSGLEEMFLEIGVPVRENEFLPPPPLDEEGLKHIQEVAQKYGQKMYPPDYFLKG
ncbi:Cupin 2, conserved barrel [Pedobacter sp. BAL39]|uniref:cupin domain-containing protein n=1 Tax=Pedobacter sp. BAL39 TaxID=391596 RepID=UPI000155983C|nr:cupin domain-containing protein [Pedobacter sp. BAL39]EDM36216.1 Cupin 2, conserved barrel [Pedobacter sp. BAL39]